MSSSLLETTFSSPLQSSSEMALVTSNGVPSSSRKDGAAEVAAATATSFPLASSSVYKAKSDTLPIPHAELLEAAKRNITPFHIYDETTIRRTCQALYQAFTWVDGTTAHGPKNRGFQNFFAVKALPNPAILAILKEERFGMDCSSLAELVLCDWLDISGEDVMLTSNNTSLRTFAMAKQMGAIINIDDLTHLDFLHQNIGLPDVLCFRYNPGASRKGNVIIGHPEEAKFGMTARQLVEAFKSAQKKGVRRFGLHTMVVSNCLNIDELEETAKMMFEMAVTIYVECNVVLEFVNLGGGIGIAYTPTDIPVDFAELGRRVQKQYDAVIRSHERLHPLRVVYENGRCITGSAGCLVTRVVHQKNTYKKYIGVDGSIANLMRPALYGAYHHITIIPDNSQTRSNIFTDVTPDTAYDVIGSLCENNDKLALDRSLGVVQVGDLLVVHDTGAHGHCMGFNYNGVLRSAEYLRVLGGSVLQIRRAETLDDLFQTIIKDGPCGRMRGALLDKSLRVGPDLASEQLGGTDCVGWLRGCLLGGGRHSGQQTAQPIIGLAALGGIAGGVVGAISMLVILTFATRQKCVR